MGGSLLVSGGWGARGGYPCLPNKQGAHAPPRTSTSGFKIQAPAVWGLGPGPYLLFGSLLVSVPSLSGTPPGPPCWVSGAGEAQGCSQPPALCPSRLPLFDSSQADRMSSVVQDQDYSHHQLEQEGALERAAGTSLLPRVCF